jgi:hypothetical protein
VSLTRFGGHRPTGPPVDGGDPVRDDCEFSIRLSPGLPPRTQTFALLSVDEPRQRRAAPAPQSTRWEHGNNDKTIYTCLVDAWEPCQHVEQVLQQEGSRRDS